MEVVPNLSKCRVRAWMLYQAYTKESGTDGMRACTHTRTRTLVFQQGRTRYQGILPLADQTYQSIGYGYGCRTELTKVWGTGMDVVPNLPKCGVRVWKLYQAYQRVGYGHYKGHALLVHFGTYLTEHGFERFSLGTI